MKFKQSMIVALLLVTTGIFANDDDKKADAVASLLQERLPSIQVEYISESAVGGLYEVIASGQLLYISEDGNHLFNGNLFNIENGIVNLTEDTKQRIDSLKNPMRREAISEVSTEEMIVFAAENEKYRISVFTDVDCGYCRKLHREMEKYNELGITVQYLGYPRAGIGSPSHAKLRSIWCATDPNAAMNRGKIQREFGTDTCEDPLVDHMRLVRDFGLSGTPAIIFASGRLLPGYVEPARLIKMLEADAAEMANQAKVSASGS